MAVFIDVLYSWVPGHMCRLWGGQSGNMLSSNWETPMISSVIDCHPNRLVASPIFLTSHASVSGVPTSFLGLHLCMFGWAHAGPVAGPQVAQRGPFGSHTVSYIPVPIGSKRFCAKAMRCLITLRCVTEFWLLSSVIFCWNMVVWVTRNSGIARGRWGMCPKAPRVGRQHED